MRKNLLLGFFCSVAILSGFTGTAQILEWKLVNPVFNATDPDGAGPATGSVTFTLQIHKQTAGTVSNISAISTGYSWQSTKAMVPTTPGCATVNQPANIVLSSAFT